MASISSSRPRHLASPAAKAYLSPKEPPPALTCVICPAQSRLGNVTAAEQCAASRSQFQRGCPRLQATPGSEGREMPLDTSLPARRPGPGV